MSHQRKRGWVVEVGSGTGEKWLVPGRVFEFDSWTPAIFGTDMAHHIASEHRRIGAKARAVPVWYTDPVVIRSRKGGKR